MKKSIHKQLVNEEEDLFEKYSNLLIYASTKEYFKLSLKEQRLIIEQLAYMRSYLSVVRQRIEYLSETKKMEEK